ncbi:MAG: hypothetical protein ABH862_00330 [Candidatus Omnitrophota bacterium]
MKSKNKNGSLTNNVIYPLFILSALVAFQPLSSSYADAQENINASDTSLYPGGLISLAEDILISSNLCEQGKTLYQDGDYANARLKFQQALLRDPANKSAKKFIDLCDKQRAIPKNKIKTRKPAKKKWSFTKEKKPAGGKDKLDEDELAFLESLEKRVVTLEPKQFSGSESYVPQEETPEKPIAKEMPQKTSKVKSNPFLEEMKKIKISESLIQQGDQFYSKEMYDKAYNCYLEAFRSFTAKNK